MLRNIVYHCIGGLSVSLYFLNTFFWVWPILLLSLLKLLPFSAWQTAMSYLLDACATAWISLNNVNQRCTSRTRWEVNGLEGLSRHDWYLVIANHQSWVDILVLQRIFNRRIPFLKFFLKKELIWVPFLGLAWWALDFPFMRRYSKDFLAKHPELKGKDMETTRKACEKFRFKPVSIMNFVEGTRFSAAKHNQQGSPYQFLLKPKAGGMAFVLSAMGEQLHKLVDVTIDYPQGIPTYWDFVCGRVNNIRVNVNVTPIQELFQKGYFSSSYFDEEPQRQRFQDWLNMTWQAKDNYLLTNHSQGRK